MTRSPFIAFVMERCLWPDKGSWKAPVHLRAIEAQPLQQQSSSIISGITPVLTRTIDSPSFVAPLTTLYFSLYSCTKSPSPRAAVSLVNAVMNTPSTSIRLPSCKRRTSALYATLGSSHAIMMSSLLDGIDLCAVAVYFSLDRV